MSAWQVVGWAGNACFFARFLVQWWCSERERESVAPAAFWWLSLVGTLLLGGYVYRQADWLLLASFCVNAGVYVRNVWLAHALGPARLGLLSTTALGLVACTLLVALARGPLAPPGTRAAWVAVALLGQALWSSRFVLQWWHSERLGRSHFPPSFWWVSLAGNLLLLAYAIQRADAIYIASFLLGPVIQVRNLVLGRRAAAARAPRAPADARALGAGR